MIELKMLGKYYGGYLMLKRWLNCFRESVKIAKGEKESMADYICQYYHVTKNQAKEILIKTRNFHTACKIAGLINKQNPYKAVMGQMFKEKK